MQWTNFFPIFTICFIKQWHTTMLCLPRIPCSDWYKFSLYAISIIHTYIIFFLLCYWQDPWFRTLLVRWIGSLVHCSMPTTTTNGIIQLVHCKNVHLSFVTDHHKCNISKKNADQVSKTVIQVVHNNFNLFPLLHLHTSLWGNNLSILVLVTILIYLQLFLRCITLELVC